MPNRFEQAYQGEEPLPSTDAGVSGGSSPFDSVPAVANPFDKVTTSAPKSEPAVSATVPSGPASPFDSVSPKAVTPAKTTGQAANEAFNSFMGPPAGLKEAADEFEKSEKSAWDYLKFGIKQMGAASVKAQEQSPLAPPLKAIGSVLGAAQEYVGHPVAMAALKSAMVPKAAPGSYMGGMGSADLELTPEEQEFRERFEGQPMAKDLPPSKFHDASSKEVMLRRFLSATAGDRIKLSEAQEAPGLANITQAETWTPLGNIEWNKVLAKSVELGGEAPYYLVAPTGVGGRVTALEKARLLTLEQAAPKQMLKQVAAANRMGATAEMAVQSGVVGAKNKEDPLTSAVEGGVMGNVLHRLGGLVTANSAAKKEILSSLTSNAAREGAGEVGAVLPPVTWKQYLADALASEKRAAELKGPKIRRAQQVQLEKPETGAVGYLKETPKTEKYVAPVIEGKMGDEKSPYSFKTIGRGKAGELREERYLQNVDGTSKKVYSEKLSRKHYDEYEKGGDTPVATDGDAYSDYLDWRFPTQQGKQKVSLGLGNLPYKSPEEAAAFIDKGIVAKPPAKVGAPLTESEVERALEPTRVLSVDKKGNVKVEAVVDRAPNNTKVLPVAEGDVVHLPDNSPALVEKIRDDVATVNVRGQKVEVPTASLVHADEDLLSIADIVGAEPAASATPKKTEALLKLKHLDIQRVMNVTGNNDPVAAAKLLNEMHAAGQLVRTNRPGEYRVEASHRPEFKEWDRKDADKLVYYAVDNVTGRGKSGVLRGRDPKNPNNYIVEVGSEELGLNNYTNAHADKTKKLGLPVDEVFVKTRKISVPAEEVRPFFVGNAKKSNLPAIYGVTRPMPKDAVVTSEATAKAIADYSRKNGMLNKITGVSKEAIKTGLGRIINHDAWLLPTDVRQVGTRLASQPGIVKAKSEIYQTALANRLGGELSHEDQWLADIAKRRANKAGKPLSDQERGLVRFFSNNPQLNQEVRTTVEGALGKLKANQQELARLGVTNIADQEAMRMLGLEDEYTMNVYLKYLMARKDFASFVKKQLPAEWDNAVRLISQRRKGEYAWQTEAQMLEVLGMDIETATKQAAKDPSGAAAKKLKERKALADEMQKVLGKLDSASIQVAHGLAASESIINRVRDWNTLQQTAYWSPGPRPDLGPHGGVQVPNSPIYGAAAGGWMHEGFRFLLEAKPAHIEGRQLLRTISSAWKFNQVVGGGFAPWVNQVMRNWKGMVLSGGLSEPADFATFFDAADQMLKYRDNPILNSANIFGEAINNGANSTGFAGNEINKNKAAFRILDAIRKQRGNSKDMHELMQTLPNHIKGGAQEIGAMYDAIDRLFKLTAYMNIRRNALAKGMSVDDAAALATMRVNQSFVNFEMVAPWVEKMRSGSVSGIAPFLSSKMEDMRINSTALMRLKDEPDLVARLMGATAIVAGLGTIMKEERKANGITDEMVTKAADANKLAIQAYKPASFVLPNLDSEGRMQLADVTTWEDLAMMLRKHETDSYGAAILRNNITDLFGENTLAGGGVNQVMSQATGIVPLAPGPDMRYKPGEYGPLELMAFLAQSGGVPQGALKAYHQYMLTQPPETYKQQIEREQWTPEQGLAKFLGAPFSGPVGNATAVGRAREFAGNESQMEQQIRQTIMNKPRDDWKRLIDAKIQQLKSNAEEFNENR